MAALPMIKRSLPLYLTLAAMAALSSCGGESNSHSEAPDSAPAANAVDKPDDSPVEVTADPPPTNTASSEVGGSCTEADAAMDALLPKFEASASTNGVLLDDGRGFIDGYSAVVRGQSGRVFRIDVPTNIDIADPPATMQSVVDILLTR